VKSSSEAIEVTDNLTKSAPIYGITTVIFEGIFRTIKLDQRPFSFKLSHLYDNCKGGLLVDTSSPYSGALKSSTSTVFPVMG